MILFEEDPIDDAKRRAIRTKYANWQQDLIIKDIRKSNLPYSVYVENNIYDNNLAAIIRTANGFGAKKVYYSSIKKKFNPTAAVGAQYYTDVVYIKEFEDVIKLQDEYEIVGIELTEDALDYSTVEYLPNTLFVFGSESGGISPKMMEYCDRFVQIPLLGTIRSLNVSTCAGIILSDYVRKFKYLHY